MVVRATETVGSRELARLEQGQQCRIIAHGSQEGSEPSRRLLVRFLDGEVEGWVSCATKGGRRLLEPQRCGGEAGSGAWLQLENTARETSQTLVCISAPRSADEDDRQGLSPEELLAEASAVWTAFTGLGEREDPASGQEGWQPWVETTAGSIAAASSSSSPSSLASSRLEAQPAVASLRSAGTWLDRVDEVDEEQAALAERRRLRLMEEERERKQGRDRKLKEGIKRTLATRSSELQMPSMRGIAPSFSGASSSSGGFGLDVGGWVGAPAGTAAQQPNPKPQR